MARLHITFGLLLFAVFLITGQFMRADFPDKDAIDQTLRLLMRSRHIYILFSALIHVGIGIYVTRSGSAWRRRLQYFGSVLMICASVVLVAAFVFETYSSGTYSELSRVGIYLSVAAIVLHGSATIGEGNSQEATVTQTNL